MHELERLLQIAQEAEGVDRLEKKSRQEQARMTQSGTDSPMTDDDTSSESDSESDREDEDDNLTEQTHGERLLEMAKEAIKAVTKLLPLNIEYTLYSIYS